MANTETRIKILVCDDDTKRASRWASRLESILVSERFEVTSLATGAFGRAVGALHRRVQAGREGIEVVREDDASVFDSADVVLIDSDLTPDLGSTVDPSEIDAVNDHLVGEYGSNVAWLARNFSSAGVLVVINHIFKERTFDLTMSRFSELPADAYVSAPDLDNRGLWFGETGDGFRPWSWPNLTRLLELVAWNGATESFEMQLDSTVCGLLDLDEQGIGLVDDRQWERLVFDASSPEAITLRDVSGSAVFGLGQHRDARLSDERRLRIAQAALRRWLDQTVIPAQNVYIDLPHLIQDRPWLAEASRGDAEAMTRLVADSWSGRSSILPEICAQSASELAGRTVWRVQDLPRPTPDQRLVADDLVFCEDISGFRHPENAKEFSSDIEGAYRSRFVAKIPDVEYTPKRRLFV